MATRAGAGSGKDREGLEAVIVSFEQVELFLNSKDFLAQLGKLISIQMKSDRWETCSAKSPIINLPITFIQKLYLVNKEINGNRGAHL